MVKLCLNNQTINFVMQHKHSDKQGIYYLDKILQLQSCCLVCFFDSSNLNK